MKTLESFIDVHAEPRFLCPSLPLYARRFGVPAFQPSTGMRVCCGSESDQK